MTRNRPRVTLFLGSLATLAALAPAPRAADEPETLRALALAKVAMAKKIADFYAEPRSVLVDRQLNAPGRPTLPDEVRASIQLQDEIEVWAKKTVDAKIEVSASRDERIAILAEDLNRTRANEKRLKDLAENMAEFTKLVVFKAEFYRLEAEYRLAMEKNGR